MKMRTSHISTEEILLERMTTPTRGLIDHMRTVQSPLVLLGAGGKMGPSLAVLAKRAALEAKRDIEVIAVSRFTDTSASRWLQTQGVRTVTADLLNHDAYPSLPEALNVIYLVGLKFGTSADPSATWAANTVIPTWAATRYPRAKWSILSTGNVYPLVDIHSGGARENHPLTPIGEYANAAVARERVFEFFSRRNGTPMTFLRLSYAIDLRYGVLVDLALKVWRGESVEVGTPLFNCIWQGDANEMVIRSLAHATSPPLPVNLTGEAPVSVREAALALGKCMGREPVFVGQEAQTALLSSTELMRQTLGTPSTSLESMIQWVADWVMTGGRLYNRPTHFEVRDGKY